jgi:DNA-binding NarL/FixJ family response regulator
VAAAQRELQASQRAANCAACGFDLCPARCMIGGTSGSDTKLAQPCSSLLQLAARGLTTRQIADRLVISPKTADHHIQHIYTKIGVSTRAAAALWAMQNDFVG